MNVLSPFVRRGHARSLAVFLLLLSLVNTDGKYEGQHWSQLRISTQLSSNASTSWTRDISAFVHGSQNGKLSSTDAFQQRRLRLCNDVHTHPGPKHIDARDSPALTTNAGVRKQRRVKNPCTSCGRGVTAASRAVTYDQCEYWTHLRCTREISTELYNHYVENKVNFTFLCDACSISSLPFVGAEIDSDNDATRLPSHGGDEDESPAGGSTNDTHAAGFLASLKGLSFLHSNVRSLIPKLSEIRHLLHDSKAAILAVTETWLDDTVSDGEINVDGYNFVRLE